MTARDAPTLRLLTGEAAEMAAVQNVLQAAPHYAQLITGAPPSATEASDTFAILPPGKTYDDKAVLGVFFDEHMIGCIDLVLGYPDASCAFVGLLVIDERCQRRGLGSAAHLQLEQWVRDRSACDRARLAVVGVNDPAIAFWTSVGFAPTRETSPYCHGHVISELVLFEKSLGPPTDDD